MSSLISHTVFHNVQTRESMSLWFPIRYTSVFLCCQWTHELNITAITILWLGRKKATTNTKQCSQEISAPKAKSFSCRRAQLQASITKNLQTLIIAASKHCEMTFSNWKIYREMCFYFDNKVCLWPGSRQLLNSMMTKNGYFLSEKLNSTFTGRGRKLLGRSWKRFIETQSPKVARVAFKWHRSTSQRFFVTQCAHERYTA